MLFASMRRATDKNAEIVEFFECDVLLVEF